jgi:hypothetical protein
MGIEPTIPAFERAKTVHALDLAATVIGEYTLQSFYFSMVATIVNILLINVILTSVSIMNATISSILFMKAVHI